MNFLKENVTPILAISVTILCFLVLFVGLRSQVCEANKEIVMLILGGILTTLTTVVGFYFGSSQGSRDKNVVIGKALDEKEKRGK